MSGLGLNETTVDIRTDIVHFKYKWYLKHTEYLMTDSMISKCCWCNVTYSYIDSCYTVIHDEQQTETPETIVLAMSCLLSIIPVVALIFRLKKGCVEHWHQTKMSFCFQSLVWTTTTNHQCSGREQSSLGNCAKHLEMGNFVRLYFHFIQIWLVMCSGKKTLRF